MFFYFAVVATASYLETLQSVRNRFSAFSPASEGEDFDAAQLNLGGCIYDREQTLENCTCVFKSECSAEILIDHCETEIPPTEGTIRQIAALEFFRHLKLVPQIIHEEFLDPRLVVTEFVGRGSLRNVKFKLSVSRIAAIGSRLLVMLKQIHSAGVVHANLVPHNIVFSWDEMVDSLRITGWQRSRSVSEIPKPSEDSVHKLNKRSMFADIRAKMPRDDIAAVAETIINLLCGNEDLFPSEYVAKNMDGDSVRVLRLGRTGVLKLSFPSLASGFLKFYDYALNLEYEDRIEYDEWIDVLGAISLDETNQLPLGEKSPIDLRNLNMDRAQGFKTLSFFGSDNRDAARQVFLKSGCDIGVSVYDEVYDNLTPLSKFLTENPHIRASSRSLAELTRELIKVIRKVHEHGFVHNGIKIDSFFRAKKFPDDTWIWKIDGFDKASLFVDPQTWSHRPRHNMSFPHGNVDLSTQSLFLLRDRTNPSRRDDVLALAELVFDIIDGRPRPAIYDLSEAISWKNNRYVRFASGRFATFARLYRHAASMGYFERPDYESAIEELSSV